MDTTQSRDLLKGVRRTILVGNLSPEVLEEDLRNYLEGWIDVDVDIVRYTRDHTQAVVTFKQDTDLQEGKQLSKPLDGKKPTVSSLEATNQLSVWGVQISSMEKEIITYFESPSSGNIDRTVITGKSEMDGVIILTFHDPRAVQDILAKDGYRIGQQGLFVEEFYQEVGAPVWNEGNIETKKCPIHNILTTRILLVTNFIEKSIFKELRIKATIDKGNNVVEFVGPSLFVKFAFEELLQSVKAMASHNKDIDLSRIKVKLLDNDVTAEYLMKKMIQNGIQGAWRCFHDKAKVRLKSTTDDGLRGTEELIKFSLIETKIEAEGITDVQCAELHRQVEARNPELYFIIHKQGNGILLVATDADVESLKNTIRFLVEKVQRKDKDQEYIQRMQIQDEDMKSTLPLSPLKTRYIQLRMQEDVNQIQKQYNVKVLAEEEGFRITGERDSCKDAIIDLWILADKLKVKEDKWEGSYMTELYKNDLIPFITQYLEQREDCAAEVFVKSYETITVADDFSVHLLVGDFPLDSDAVMVAVDENLEPLGFFAQSVHKKGGIQVREEFARHEINKGCLEFGEVVMTTAGSLPNVRKIIHASFPETFESMEQEEELVYNAVMTTLVCAEEEKLESVAISILENEASVSFATRGVVKSLANHLTNRVTNYVKHVIVLCQDRLIFEAYSKNSSIFWNYLEGNDGEASGPANMLIPQQQQQLQQEHRLLLQQEVEQCSYKTGSVKITLVKGTIADQKVDVLVNSVNRGLDLNNGAVSASIVKKGGPAIQDEVETLYGPYGVEFGEFVESGGGKLRCKVIYHTCLPGWSTLGDQGQNIAILTTLVIKCLNQANRDRYHSIAFPAFGTGILGYPKDQVAEAMYKAVAFFSGQFKSTLAEVRFVVYKKDKGTVSAFEKMHALYETAMHEPTSQGAVRQRAMRKEPHISSNTRVLYRVTSAENESLRSAKETLKTLNTKSKEFFEKITDTRLKSLNRFVQSEFTMLGTDSVKVSLNRQEMEIKITGDSLEALKILRNVVTMTELFETKTASELTLKTGQRPPRCRDTAPTHLTPEGRGITSIDNTLSSTKVKVKNPQTEFLHNDALDHWEIPKNSLKLIREIGHGSFGEVWEGLWNETSVAIKTLKPGTMDVKDFLKEAQIMKTLHHKNLIELYAVCTKDEPIYIVTEFVKNGNLLEYLRDDMGQVLKLPQLIDIAAQIACGMAYLESKMFIHRDLAARNILVGHFCIKIADFGLAKAIKGDVYMAQKGSIFPVKWTAPEAVKYNKFSIKSDVWSFGIVLTEIVTYGGKPYPAMSNKEVLENLQDGYRMPCPSGCPKTLYDIMLETWHEDELKRPTFKSLHSRLEELVPLSVAL